MSFFSFAADSITNVILSLATNSLGDSIINAKTARHMKRLVEESVDQIVEQAESYLDAEKLSDSAKELLIFTICSTLKPLAENPRRFFAGDLDGARIFDQCHPEGKLPQEIREEKLEQFYNVLFPRIAHFIVGSRVALAEWKAEGFREGFKRLREIAEELGKVSIKVADLPIAVMRAFADEDGKQSDSLVRAISQSLLNDLLLKLDLSPLRPERSLHGSLCEHFVIPAFLERKEEAQEVGHEKFLLEVLAKKGSRHVVFGGAGTGKTTWSQWMQSRLLQNEVGRLAVVLKLRTVTNIEKHSLLDIIHEVAGVHLREDLTMKMLHGWNDAGRLVVILDGFDEIPEKRRGVVEKWIKELSSVLKQSTLILTSRTLQSGHLEALEAPWKRWDLLTFDQPRVIEFIERWHCYLPEGELSDSEREVDATSLADTFYNDPSLSVLANTPLMLGTLLFVHHKDKKLPNGRVDLYERYIAAMLGLRDSGLGIEARATKLTDKQKRKVLSYIALHFHIEQINEVNDDIMHQLVSRALEKFEFKEAADQLLPALCERTGLLQGPGAWSFMHKTIGEFFVAELVCDGITKLPDGSRLDRKELWSHWEEDTWTSVLFFWAGKTSAKELEEFIIDLLGQDDQAAFLLALSLMNDQGYRLDVAMVRALALKLITNFNYSDANRDAVDRITALCSRPHIPDYLQPEGFVVQTYYLRGLTHEHTLGAFTLFFRQSILKIEDLTDCNSSCIEALIMSAIWAGSETFTEQGIKKLISTGILTEQDLALYYFSSTFNSACSKKVDEKQLVFNDWITDWEKVFPEMVVWSSMLLAGTVVTILESQLYSNDDLQYIWPLLFERREEVVDESFLLNSNKCTKMSGNDVEDLLGYVEFTLSKSDLYCVGLDPKKRKELVEWCGLLKAKRTELLKSK